MASSMSMSVAPLHDESSAPVLKSDNDGLNELAVARGDSVWVRFKFEWKPENLWFTGNYPNTYGKLHWTRAFGNSGSGCWCCSRAYGDERSADFPLMTPARWIAWRVLVFAYLFAILIWSLVVDWNAGYWFIFLTNWQSSIFVAYGTLSLFSAIYINKYYQETLTGDFTTSAKLIGAAPGSTVEYKIPVLVKATWIAQGLAMSLGIWVTIIFWLIVAVFGYYDNSRLPYALLNHFSTIFIVILDFSFASFPWLLFQFVWSAIIAIVFTIWSIIFHVLDLTNPLDEGHYIYEGLDWNAPVATGIGITIMITIGIPLASIVVWVLSSEAMGRFAPRRLVPWVDQDGPGGHRFRSWKKPGQAAASTPAAEISNQV